MMVDGPLTSKAKIVSNNMEATAVNSNDPAKIVAMRAALSDLLEREDAAAMREFVTDACVRRYLRARSGNVKKASAMLRKTLAWRAKARPQDARCGVCARNPHGHNMRAVGEDPGGRPVLYTCFAQANERWTTAANIDHLMRNLESTIAAMDAARGVEKMLWVIDFHGFSMRDAFQPATTLQTARLLDHYPERLHRAVEILQKHFFRSSARRMHCTATAPDAHSCRVLRNSMTGPSWSTRRGCSTRRSARRA